ncbi:hypothetical protein BABINDRAFT_145934 [Babjeviella inositovora NRRL Y-12698]|uniref:Uncharacterized protein n=1 Tax=Babjeviella inositovora NRRL Y-12698 TaxID=984486 RepID=A0A1E3QPS1_9ASCO|nr:uncharacterized protein BABINDRAFT_145934 [Babjeviella inositovora NRRL Y-12698]ODQ79650.1 hypothetical protein BABINDRAFT_145934 [Babjeviella inositovora NRRL Y-12698]
MYKKLAFGRTEFCRYVSFWRPVLKDRAKRTGGIYTRINGRSSSAQKAQVMHAQNVRLMLAALREPPVHRDGTLGCKSL